MIRKIQDMLVRAGSAQGATTSTAGRAGFTLLEILIAVAALGLIAVGVASIFDATGKTLAAGKRVSAFNAYASLIEQQLRADISAMTRDGFLVIRNEYADGDGNGTINVPPVGQTNADCVFLYEGDEKQRLRRIDELMFFAKGKFASARTALDPQYLAESDAARIYYGHGQRGRVPTTPFNATDRYNQPELDGTLATTGQEYDSNARLGYDYPENPNKFASEWTLLRHVTLLSPPRTAQANPTPILGLTANQMLDSSIQVSLQPAASDVFRRLAVFFPENATMPAAIRPGRPVFGSGLVDIATTDLSRIRAVVCTAQYGPVTNQFYDGLNNLDPNEGQNPGVDGQYKLAGAAPLDPNLIINMHQWMDDAFPANSMATPATQRLRTRYEASPRNFLGSLGQPTQAEEAFRPADQVMLSASNFLPRCTEFIVEWSFGDTRTSDTGNNLYRAEQAGQFIWHGLARTSAGKVVCGPYDQTILGEGVAMTFARMNGTVGQRLVTAQVIHKPNFTTNPPTAGGPLTSYFGFFDPGFNPDADGDGKLESPTDSLNPTIPWAWPKLIRVTLSLADPADPTIERTFQFVFDVPEVN